MSAEATIPTLSRNARLGLGWKAALLFAVIFLLYFFTRSRFLDEWDSVQFAMGVREFNLWKHQPHPPGYPLYIFLGWIGSTVWRWDPEFSLHIVSCFGGAVFVTAWFLIVRLHFGERFAWLIAGSLAATPVVWMTSTQVLTDIFAAGLLSAELLLSLLYLRSGRVRDLIMTALIGAATTGTRPQLIPVVAVILLAPVLRSGAPLKIWLTAIVTFLAACLSWLLPTCYLAAKVTPQSPAWSAYAEQLYSQWKWLLDKPHASLGAGDLSPRYLGLRFAVHILGWLGVGFGFLRSAFTLALGGALAITGLGLYVRYVRKEDREFWKTHRTWAALHILTIFCFLPANQRYYLIIFPLLLIAIQRGLLQLPERWRLAFFLMPIVLLAISIPLAIENHREAPPAMRFVRYLQQHHAVSDQKDVILFLKECKRQVEWYAPEFTKYYTPLMPLSKVDPEILIAAHAIYTDDQALVMPPGWRLMPVADFHRSLLIELKQRDVSLYRVERTPTP